MSDRDDKLNKGELIDIKSLIGNADGGDFSLDDILAEYGHPPQEAPAEPEEAPGGQEERFNTIDLSTIPRPQTVPRPKAAARSGGNVVSFPGGRAVQPPEEPGEPPPPPEEAEDLPPAEEARITPFPRKRNRLSALVHDLNQRADDYAEHMFEEDESIDKAEVRRLERLIPGTDREELDDEPPSRQWRHR